MQLLELFNRLAATGRAAPGHINLLGRVRKLDTGLKECQVTLVICVYQNI